MSEPTTPAAPDTSPLNMDQAAALIAERRNAPELSDTPSDSHEPDAVVDQDTQGELATDPDDVEEPSSEDDGQEPEADEADGDEEIWEIDGQQYTAEELRKSLLRQSDYTKKAQALAAERQEIDRIKSEAQKAAEKHLVELKGLEATRRKYDEFLRKAGQDLNDREAQFAQVDWEALAVQNPQEYSRLDAAYKQHQIQKAQVEREQARRAQERQQIEQQEAQATAVRLQEHFNARYGWSDEKKRNTELLAIRETARNAGFTDEELVNTRNPGVWDILRKAALYDQSTAKAQGVVKRDANGKPQAVKIVKPAASRPSSAKTARNANIASKYAQLDRTGSIEDAVAVLQARRRTA